MQHKLTLLRQRDLSNSRFRRLLHEISMLMVYEVTRDMPRQLIDRKPYDPSLHGNAVALASSQGG